MLAHMTVYTTRTSGHELCAMQYANLACQSGKDPKQRNAKVAAPSGAQAKIRQAEIPKQNPKQKFEFRFGICVLEFAFGNSQFLTLLSHRHA